MVCALRRYGVTDSGLTHVDSNRFRYPQLPRKQRLTVHSFTRNQTRTNILLKLLLIWSHSEETQNFNAS
ncbi:MAG: hypothetical protein P8X79_21835 [Reinekea sp.]